ncbi:MAG TPA: flagellar motor switch protein FliM, partial [Thermoanaerobacterales bacterium]|nr:flagellar motor switch protein FliM [Thermoanaerobacterales bacterium]
QLRTLHMIHENFARLLTTYLSAHLRTLVQIDVLYVEQMSYNEFVNSVPNPSVVGIIDSETLKGSGILEINPNIVFAIIDRILGGEGGFEEQVRTLTDIETTIIERIIGDMLKILQDAWENVIDIDMTLVDIESNAQFIQLIAPNETTALITFDGKIGKTSGLLNLCIPHILLEPIIDKLSARFWFSDTREKPSKQDYEQIYKIMRNSKVPVTIRLGESQITIRELLEIQEGDVIKLEKRTDELIDVLVENKIKFKGRPGVIKNKIAVEIFEVVEKVGEIYE